MDPADELIPTDVKLLDRVRDSADQEAWQIFFDTYKSFLYKAALKTGLNDAEAQDAVQETLISVSKAMRQFIYRPRHGSFKSWLLKLARWRIVDELRKRTPNAEAEPSESDENSVMEQITDPVSEKVEASWDEEWKKSLFDAAIKRVRRKADPESYQIFDFCTRKGWSVEKISGAMEISPERVYMARHRVKQMIELEIKKLQQNDLIQRALRLPCRSRLPRFDRI